MLGWDLAGPGWGLSFQPPQVPAPSSCSRSQGHRTEPALRPPLSPGHSKGQHGPARGGQGAEGLVRTHDPGAPCG